MNCEKIFNLNLNALSAHTLSEVSETFLNPLKLNEKKTFSYQTVKQLNSVISYDNFSSCHLTNFHIFFSRIKSNRLQNFIEYDAEE